MRSLTRGHLQGFETTTGAATLWRALVEPAALAHIARFEPGVRLQLLFDANPDWPPLTGGALIEDFIIDERHGQRSLRVMGSGIPAASDWAPVLKQLRAGWAVAFARLQTGLRSGDIGETKA